MDNRNVRVVQGAGIYHTPKVQYSPETHKFLKELMEESKMTTMQRQKVNYSLRSGDPLPALNPKSSKLGNRLDVIVKDSLSKRRSLNAIKDSGAYERDKFIPMHPKINRDIAKKHLQDLMTFGKDVPDLPAAPKRKEPDNCFENRFEELKHEIQERVEWLEDMERLGEGHKHRQVMEQQIAARLREIEGLKITNGSDRKDV